MLRLTWLKKPASRRGVVLLVVITLLTLFAIVGVTFVLYANAEATASRIYREAASTATTTIDISRDQLLNFAAANLIYPVPDDATGVNSGIRGHEMARNMYGWNYGTNVTAPDSGIAGSNIIPFNGPGRLHYNIPPNSVFSGDDDYPYINYMYFNGDGFVRDPERYPPSGSGLRTSPTGTLGNYVGFNPSYTYPDLNCMFLGAVKADGTVLMPSFHRPWTGFGSLDPTNGNWTSTTNPKLKYMVLRPRPADQLLSTETSYPPSDPNIFPLPATAGGDVSNLNSLAGYNGTGYDSFWVDLGYPIQTAADGTRFKPLFAFFVTDLDNKINVNVAGNVKGSLDSANVPTHVSNQGWGPWEVNPRQLVQSSNPAEQREPANILLGNPPTLVATPPPPHHPSNYVAGRYGPDQQPGTTGTEWDQPFQPGWVANTLPPYGAIPRVYGKVDFDATNGGSVTDKLTLPQSGTQVSPFASFPAGYDNASVQGGTTTELYQHPMQYDAFNPQSDGIGSASGDTSFNIATNMKLLLYDWSSGATEWQGSDLGILCPTSFGDTTPSGNSTLGSILRHQVTTYSFDVDRPGVTPWIWDPTNASYQLMTGQSYPSYYYSSSPSQLANGPMYFPTTSSAPSPPPAFGTPPTAPGVPGGTNSDFNPDWRAAYQSVQLVTPTTPSPTNLTPPPTVAAASQPYSGLGRVDLNRALPAYPQPDTNGNLDPSNTTLMAQFNTAQGARQNMAADILRRLQVATGTAPVPPSATSTTPAAVVSSNRWLAQLAINIVDYIDSDNTNPSTNPDSIMTPFYWQNPDGTGSDASSEVVFGTELPRVVINEAYCEYENNPSDPGSTGTVGHPSGKATMPYQYNFWVELLNPFPSPVDAASADNGAATLQTTTGGHNIYKLDVTTRNTSLRAATDSTANPGGNLGDPDGLTVTSGTSPFAVSSLISPGPTQMATASETGTTVTVTVPSTNGYAVGDTVAIAGMAPAGYNGSWTITAVPTGTTFTYTNSTAGLAAGTGGTAQDMNMATATVANTNFLTVGDHITIMNASPTPGYSGCFTITGKTATTFMYTVQAGLTSPATPTTGATIWYTTLLSEVASFSPNQIQAASGIAYASSNQSTNTGFYVVGPQVTFPQDTSVIGQPQAPTATLQSSAMSLPETMRQPGPVPPISTAPPTPGQTQLQSFTFMLRRLACPALPFNSTPGSGYNPYVTVDYIENVPTYDGVAIDNTGAHAFTPWPSRFAWGKKEPYAAWSALSLITQQPTPDTTRLRLVPQQPTPALTNQPQHTFFGHNYETYRAPVVPGPNTSPAPTNSSATLTVPFDWLVQLDRQVVSPVELLQVSGFRPHELTQQFVAPPYYTTSQVAVTTTGTPQPIPVSALFGFTNVGPWSIAGGNQLIVDTGPNQEVVTVSSSTPPNFTTNPPTFTATFNKPHPTAGFPIFGSTPQPFAHTAPWYDQNSRLYRLLEFLGAGSRAAGIGVGGRIPGKLNINTIWDLQTFLALCDPQATGSSTNPNYFSAGDISGAPSPSASQGVYNQMMSTRSPDPAGGTNYQVGPTNMIPSGGFAASGYALNRPFLGLAGPYTPTVVQLVTNLAAPTTGTNVTATATVASTSGFSNGDTVTISGATCTGGPPGGYDGTFTITVTSGTTFTYTIPLAPPSSPASGTIIAQVSRDKQFPATGAGIEDTLLRSKPGAGAGNAWGRLFDVQNPNSDTIPVNHPYLQTQILSKIYNNLTTRSNVFAVWVTVGFFGVRNDPTNPLPVKLGAEIGLSTQQNIRHKMFFIVDRTNLTIAPGAYVAQMTQAVNPPNANKPMPQPVTWQTNAQVSSGVFQGTTSPSAPCVPISWTIQVGSTLVVDTGVNQETVVVTAVNTTTTPYTFTANFMRSHPANTPITIPGNPGPQPLFNPVDPKYAAVVPYFAILQ
jgi:hypothetical protein